MIIGRGDIAAVLPDREDRIYFASGVSDSKESRASEFAREKKLLFEQFDLKKHLVYFSSLSVFYSDTPYAQHKRKMETYTRMFPQHTIIRIGNITWGKNPNTIINFFKNRVAQGLPLEIQDVYRYVTDKEEFLHWINLIPNWSCEINIPGRRLKVQEIVKEFVYGNN